MLAAAFARCAGETCAQAREMLAALLARPGLPADVRREAIAVAIAVEFNADNFDRVAALIAELKKTYPDSRPASDRRIFIQNQDSYLLLFSGSPHLARHRCDPAIREDLSRDLDSRKFKRTYIVGTYIVGLSLSLIHI